MIDMNEKTKALLKSLKPILEAIDVNDGDTLAGLSPDSTIIWEATGSWSVPAPITLGDLRKIKMEQKRVAEIDIEKWKKFIDDGGDYSKATTGYLLVKGIEDLIALLPDDGGIYMQDKDSGARFLIKRVE